VKFDADHSVVLTTGTRAVIRYLNLVGDRYLELVTAQDPPRCCRLRAEIPIDRTALALDLDLLLGGLKPVTQASTRKTSMRSAHHSSRFSRARVAL